MKTLWGATAGAAVMLGIVLACLVPLFFMLGPEGALVASTQEFNTLWIAISMVVCMTAASIGGWVAHRVAGSIGAVISLIAVVVVFGLLDAGYHQLVVPVSTLIPGQTGWLELLIGLREPLWYDLSLPVLMGIFVWVAGSGRDTETKVQQ